MKKCALQFPFAHTPPGTGNWMCLWVAMVVILLEPMIMLTLSHSAVPPGNVLLIIVVTRLILQKWNNSIQLSQLRVIYLAARLAAPEVAKFEAEADPVKT